MKRGHPATYGRLSAHREGRANAALPYGQDLAFKEIDSLRRGDAGLQARIEGIEPLRRMAQERRLGRRPSADRPAALCCPLNGHLGLTMRRLSAQEVERLYGLSARTLANYRVQKIGPRYSKCGRRVVYSPKVA